ncbi:carbohydrate-binding domain-containing protein [Oscillibacter sp.]|uniref:carbohydrate-binding domain-containing protein n=1 Tax=Oscillibacter sp. TaxID=1945593 RepID=UPI00262FB8B3|nr:carbohydrate-binding domain-containing protein [Oscillibacter sp.]MDD3347821.1 carbohydrate-binding domain-containing protein [Oscillibacter sp.]
MKKKPLSLLLAALLLLSATACGNTSANNAADSAAADTLSTVIATPDEMFTDRDYEVGYSDYVTVSLADGGTTADGDGVTVNGSTVTITAEGTYLLTGTLSDGQVIVNAADTAKIQLVLENASVTCNAGAALYIKSADKVFLTLADGSASQLVSTGTFAQTDDTNVDAALFAKSDLTMNGSGVLSVTCESGHGVVSKDDLKVIGGTYFITAASQGLSGKDSVRIAGGDFTIIAGKDGIHAENTEAADQGFIYIANGIFTVDAEGDGADASGAMTILDGTFHLTTGGGSANVRIKTESGMSDGFRGTGGAPIDAPNATPPVDATGTPPTAATATPPSDVPGAATPAQSVPDTTAAELSATATENNNTSAENAASTKGLKAGAALVVTGGDFTIDAADDAIHTNGDLLISGGAFSITTGDDGMHADGALTIRDGTIAITKSYEGMEAAVITIAGGSIDLTSSNDGLNAAGGNDGSGSMGGDTFGADSGGSILISGGTLHISAEGDGIDSNGDLTVSGGSTYVSGPTNSGNGALDYAGSAAITGGVLIASGAMGMEQNFGSSSTQGSILCQLSAVQGVSTTITLKDADGNILATCTPSKEFQSVVISAPEVKSSGTYTLTVGSEEQTIEMTDIIYGTGSQMGGVGGAAHGGMNGQRPDGTGGTRPSRQDRNPTTGATPQQDSTTASNS